MFGRGTWAILGLAKESLETFRTNLEDRNVMAACSQLAAVAVTRQFSADAHGINPFRSPRLDEDHPIGLEHQEALALYATTEHEAGSDDTLPAEVVQRDGRFHRRRRQCGAVGAEPARDPVDGTKDGK